MLLFFNISFAQNNLVSNGSFENFVNLNQPSLYGKFWAYNPTYTQIVNDWLTINSPDHFDSAFIPGGYHVPYSRFGNSHAKTGYAYAGICVYDIRYDYQEYPYQHLSTPLKADSIYCLSFFTKRTARLPFAVKSIGASFSINVPTLSGGYVNAIPQVVNNAGFLTDTANWTEVQGCFTAQGGEEYITIGNFNTNSNIDTLRIQSSNLLTGTGTDIAYYYVDSVRLWKNNFPTGIKNYNKENKISVYPNPASSVINIKKAESASGIEVCRIKITDVLGREVLVIEYKEQLNIAHLERGIYFLSIIQGSKTLGIKMVIKE
jgi:hypothetical protein